MTWRVLLQLTRIAAWLSQGLNCLLLLGHHDQTVSARCYIYRNMPGWRVAYRVINAVFFWQDNHCLRSFCRDVEFAQSVANINQGDNNKCRSQL